MVGTGVAVALPPGYAGFVHPRSGLAARAGLSVVNTPGTVDSGYRGEIRVCLINHDPRAELRLRRGDRIAQLVVQRVERVRFVEVPALPGVRARRRWLRLHRRARAAFRWAPVMARRGRGCGSARTKPTPGGRRAAVNGSVARAGRTRRRARCPHHRRARAETVGGAGSGSRRRAATTSATVRATHGPFDEDDLDPEHAAPNRVDFGAVRVPVPRGRRGVGRARGRPAAGRARDAARGPALGERAGRAPHRSGCGRTWPPRSTSRCARAAPPCGRSPASGAASCTPGRATRRRCSSASTGRAGCCTASRRARPAPRASSTPPCA